MNKGRMFFFTVPIVVKYKKESSSFNSSLLARWLCSVLGNILKSVLALFDLLTTAAQTKHTLLSVSYDFLFSFFAHLLHKDCQVRLHSFATEQISQNCSSTSYTFYSYTLHNNWSNVQSLCIGPQQQCIKTYAPQNILRPSFHVGPNVKF